MTAIDTNILSDLLSDVEDAFRENALVAVTEAATRGALIISPVVFTEIGAHPHSTVEDCESILSELRIRVDWHLGELTWRLAAVRFGEYAHRRRQPPASEPRRVAADFLIGAHAAGVGRLITRDGDFFRRTFPELTIIEP